MNVRGIFAFVAVFLCAAVLWQCGDGVTDLGSGGTRDAGKPDAGMDAGRDVGKDAGKKDGAGDDDGSAVEDGSIDDVGPPDALGITGITRKDAIPSYTRLEISDPRAGAAIPAGDGYALAGDIGAAFKATREGNNEGQDREQEGESPTYWFDQAFTNLGIAMGNVGLLNPESTDGPQWVDPATGLSNDCTEDLWGEIFYLFGSPQQIWAAAIEIHGKINDPAYFAVPAARNYDLEHL